MGTPEFAAPSLKALIEEKYKIPLVVTQPDRPSGRGQKLLPPVIKTIAESHNIRVLQPGSLKKDSEERQEILQTDCDFLVVAAFGQILPQEILDHPKIAPLNIHSSLLPDYRGAAPIQRAVMDGAKQTGVTVQKMVEALDMGDILTQLPCEIAETDTSGRLHDKLKDLGAQALMQCLSYFEKDQIRPVPQNPRIGSYAKKLSKDEAKIDFRRSAFETHRQIMGLNPWPVAECLFAGQRLRVFESEFIARDGQADPGTIVDLQGDSMVVACAEACVGLKELQLENRKRLPFSEFKKGFPLQKGQILGGR